MVQIDYYFSVLSPFAYLAGDRLESIADKRGATISYRPVDIMRLFAETGGTPPKDRHESRIEYRKQELKRLSAFNNMPLKLKPAHWPTDHLPSSAMIVAGEMGGEDVGALVQAILRAVWAEDRDIGNPQETAKIVEETGLDIRSVAPNLNSAVERLTKITDEAVERGVFGSPFYIVGDERFWGQDRLSHLDAYLAQIT